MKQITFNAFRKRLANLILEEIYNSGNYDKTLAEFIFDVRGDEESNSSFGSESSSQSWSDKSEDHEFEKKISKDFDISEIKHVDKERSSSESSRRSLSGSSRNSEKREVVIEKSLDSPLNASKNSSVGVKANGKGKGNEKEIGNEKGKEIGKEKALKAQKEDAKTSKPPLNKSQTKPIPTKKLNNSTNESNSSIQNPSKSIKNSQGKVKLNDSNADSSNSRQNKISESSSSRRSSRSSSPTPTSTQKSKLSMKASEKAIKEVRQELSQDVSNNNSSSDPLSSFLLGGISIENSKKTWFSNEIRGKEAEFKLLFSSLNEGKDFLTPKIMQDAFEKSLKKLKVQPHEHHQVWFKGIHETLHPTKVIQKLGSKPKVEIPKISFVDFIEIMNLWGEKYLKEQGTVIGELIRTIDSYKENLENCKEFEALSSKMQETVAKLEVLLKKYLQSHSSDDSLEEKFKKNLEDVFQFYTKVQKIQGTDDTFEALEASNTTLNLGSFLKFCADFNILISKGEEKRGLSKEVLTSIFKKTANNTRLMSFPQFLESINKVSEVFYTPELDKQLNTNLAYLSLPEKRDMLYKQIDLDQFSKYNSKKKAFGIAFSPEKYSRIPHTESSHKYKFKLSEEDSKRLEEWKKTKNARESPLPLKPIKELAKVIMKEAKANQKEVNKEIKGIQKEPNKYSHPVIRKSVKNLPSSGYAQRSKMKKQQPEAKVEDKDQYVEEEEVIDDGPPQARVITIQALNNMRYHEFDDELTVRDLIMDDDDEFFDRLYGIEPKLQGIMKMHDEKLARAQKVVEKNKFRVN